MIQSRNNHRCISCSSNTTENEEFHEIFIIFTFVFFCSIMTSGEIDNGLTCNSSFLRYILKHKSFATLTKMLDPFFGPKQSLSDNAIDKSLYFSCIQHKNQNGVAYGCRAATIILRQPQILKSHGINTSHFMQKNLF